MMTKKPTTNPGDGMHDEAFRAVVENRGNLLAYIRIIVRDWHLVEEVMSDVAVAIARHWPTYDQSRPFGPWARTIARNTAYQVLRREGKQPVIRDDNVLEAVGQDIDESMAGESMEGLKQVLQECLALLPKKSRHVVEMRYFEGLASGQIARRLKRSANSLYVALNRIHKTLLQCMRRQLQEAQEC